MPGELCLLDRGGLLSLGRRGRLGRGRGLLIAASEEQDEPEDACGTDHERRLPKARPPGYPAVSSSPPTIQSPPIAIQTAAYPMMSRALTFVIASSGSAQNGCSMFVH